MSDLRQRWNAFGADDDEETDDLDDLDDDPRSSRRPTVRVRTVVMIVAVLGLWLAISLRERSNDVPIEATPSPRGVVDVPAGYAASAVLAPDLSMAADSVGTWALLAEEGVRLTSGTWVVVSCREAGSGEVRNAGGVLTATLGTDLVVDSTGEDGVRVAASRAGDVKTAMVLDRRPTWIATVVAANWDGDVTDLARSVYDAAVTDGCDGAPERSAQRADLPLRERRALGLPVVPVGLRIASADETTVAWTGPGAGETIVLTSQRPGTGDDDHDLIEFLRPPGDSEAEVLIGATPAYRADNLDGSEALIWQDAGVIHTLSLGTGVDADVVTLAATLRTPDDAAWQALVDAAAS